ncbi:hypothetical protein [Elioraea sp.]|uniref:hypothetical protein n=1 Tax=Elioraea sp. TaxID=2185103 RepID=UPI0025BAFC16|nr:hypothetical protein [Elioraea sp.]
MVQKEHAITDEQLMAFADGALDDAEAEAVAAAIAGDDALVARLEALERGGRLARDAFAGIAAEPVPARLVAAVIAADRATMPSVRAANAPRQPAPWRIGAAIAAGIVAGVVLGPILAGIAEREPGRGASLAALPPHVEAAFGQELSGERVASGEQRSFVLLASHRLPDGTFCRSFAIEGEDRGAGLACKRGGRWEVDAFLRQANEQVGGASFRPASGTDPLIEEKLERGQAGAPLSAAEEAEARARGWRSR